MDMRTARLELRRTLTPMYGEREAAAMAELAMAHVTGFPRIDRMLREGEALTPEQETEYTRCATELSRWRPLQYVIGEAWFGGLRFRVDERVLIPRPETDELVEWMADVIGNSRKRVLDIGTGSGCIAVALVKRCPEADITAVDKSPGALELARHNAASNDAEIGFLEADILDRGTWAMLPVYDVIASNPPYVTAGERHVMRPNVLDYEPATAVFVPGNDPLLFYRAIAEFAQTHLAAGGLLFFEIHADKGDAVCRLLAEAGFEDIQLRKDMQGLDRMVACVKPLQS